MYQKLNSKWLCNINSDKFNPSLVGKKNVPCAVKSQRVCRRKAPFEILGTFWVQGGDPQYVTVFSLSNCHNHVWPILVNFFLQEAHATYIAEAVKTRLRASVCDEAIGYCCC